LGQVGLAATLSACSQSSPENEETTSNRPRIRIGTRVNANWMQSEDDADLRFLKQIGVDYVDIVLSMVEGYNETGSFTRDAFRRLTDRLQRVGLRIERANSLGPHYLDAHLGRPGGQQQIDNLKRIGEILAEHEIPVYGIQACQAALHLEYARTAWTRPRGRGGYEYYSFDLEKTKAAPPPKYRVSSQQLWDGLLNIYRQVIPVVDGSRTRVAMHGNDPPLYEYLGNPQILCRFKDFDRLFSEVPSPNNGITFCVGTRYESGEDVLEGIRHFGRQGKLFHVHFRNVRGTLPANGGYSEVAVDEGDLEMEKVLRTLAEVNYDGVIDYDHAMGITGDKPLPKQYIAFAVGYMRGLLHSIPGQRRTRS
jgi:mannonate dehydratase